MANLPTTAMPENPGVAPARLRAPFSFLQREIDRVFNESRQGVGFSPASLDEAEFAFRPAADLHSDDNSTTIRLDLPGVDQQAINVSIIDDMIEISGEKKSQTEIDDGNRYRSERVFGSFYRSFTLPFCIDAAKVDATFHNGVLAIKIARPDGARTHATKIVIRH